MLALSWRSFKPFLLTVPDFRLKLHAFIQARRKTWELERGIDLPVSQMEQQQALEEAATMIQLEVRGWQTRRSYKEIRDKEIMRRGIATLQRSSAAHFLGKLDRRVRATQAREDAKTDA